MKSISLNKIIERRSDDKYSSQEQDLDHVIRE